MVARRTAAAAHRRRCEVQIRAAKKMGEEPVGSTPVRSPSTQMGSDDNQKAKGLTRPLAQSLMVASNRVI